MKHARTIIETAGRLPGPLAASLLADEGWHVYKVEDSQKRDPFSRVSPSPTSALFNFWYLELKKNKTEYLLDAQNKDLITQEILSSSKNFVFITGGSKDPLNSFVKELIDGIEAIGQSYQVFQIKSDQQESPLHDLDMCCEYNLVSKKRPYPLPYPVMGMMFAQRIANKILSAELRNEFIDIYFKDELKILFNKLPLKTKGSPIQGEVISYNLYDLKDSMIALTALEKENWKNFIESLKIPLSVEDRFANSNSKKGEILKTRLRKLSHEELMEISEEKGVNCFTSLN